MRESENNPQPPRPFFIPLPLAGGAVWAAWVLLIINVVIYVLTLILSLLLIPGHSGSLLSPNGGVLFLLGWKDNAQIFLFGEYWRFLTAMFLHGSVIHILSNGFALYMIGPECERIYGTLRFLGVYFVSGFAGGVASYSFSASPSVGASGAIFGLVGSLAAFFYLNRRILGDVGKSQLQSIGVIIIINVFIGFSSGGIIDNYAHLGGLAGGVLCGWLMCPRYHLDQRWYPPVVVRQQYWWGWPGLLGLAIILTIIMLAITPPILSPIQ